MDLFSVLDRINRGQWVSSQELRTCLSKSYADWHNGKLRLTSYGQGVLAILAKVA